MKDKIVKLISVVLIMCSFMLLLQPKKAFAKTNITEGVWLGKWAEQGANDIENFASLTGRAPKVVQTFVNTNQSFKDWSTTLNYIDSKGCVNLLTIEPKKADGTDYNTNEINNGALDSYFNDMAKQVKSWQNGKQIWIRFMHEVNGNWYGWSIGDSSVNTNQSYINAFRRVVNIFRKNNAYNAKFIYNINFENVGKSSSFLNAYPGNSYVDYVSIDGYNWGTTQAYSKWQSFDQIFKAAYTALIRNTTKPVIIAEYASTEVGGNKALWIKDALSQISSASYSKVVCAVWFNENKETDWRIQSSAASLAAYKSY